jgi:hypothetical protein
MMNEMSTLDSDLGKVSDSEVRRLITDSQSSLPKHVQLSFLYFNCSFPGSFLSYSSVDSRNAGPVLEKHEVGSLFFFFFKSKLQD